MKILQKIGISFTKQTSLSRRDKKLQPLYKQAASKKRLAKYLALWLGWMTFAVMFGANAKYPTTMVGQDTSQLRGTLFTCTTQDGESVRDCAGSVSYKADSGKIFDMASYEPRELECHSTGFSDYDRLISQQAYDNLMIETQLGDLDYDPVLSIGGVWDRNFSGRTVTMCLRKAMTTDPNQRSYNKIIMAAFPPVLTMDGQAIKPQLWPVEPIEAYCDTSSTYKECYALAIEAYNVAQCADFDGANERLCSEASGIITAEDSLLSTPFPIPEKEPVIEVDESESDIEVIGGNKYMFNNDTSPSLFDDTDFGTIELNSWVKANAFTIKNIGKDALNLTDNPRVTIGGTHANDFTLLLDAPASVAANDGKETFIIAFKPLETGLRTATISVANNDSDDNPFNFSIQGRGVDKLFQLDGNNNTTECPSIISYSKESSQLYSGCHFKSNTPSGSQTYYPSISLSGEFYLNYLEDFTNNRPKPSEEKTVDGGLSQKLTLEPTEQEPACDASDTYRTQQWSKRKNNYWYCFRAKGTTDSIYIKFKYVALNEIFTSVSITTSQNPEPGLISTYPERDASNIATNAKLVATFNEKVQAGDGLFFIRKSSNDSRISEINAQDPDISYDNETVTIVPPTELEGDTEYYILIQEGAIIDEEGNAFYGIDYKKTWQFTTVAASLAPEIKVSFNGAEITSDALATDFGTTTVGQPQTLTFNVSNEGDDDLSLSDFVLASGDGFSVTPLSSTPMTLSPGQDTSLKITLDATQTGDFTATASLTNNDSDEGNYELKFKGSVNPVDTPPPSSPVSGNIAIISASNVYSATNKQAITQLPSTEALMVDEYGNEGPRGDNQSTITLSRTVASSANASATGVDVKVYGGDSVKTSEYTLSPERVDWGAGDLDDKLVTLTLINDTEVELPETLTITLENPSNGATLGNATLNLSVISNDQEPESGGEQPWEILPQGNSGWQKNTALQGNVSPLFGNREELKASPAWFDGVVNDANGKRQQAFRANAYVHLQGFIAPSSEQRNQAASLYVFVEHITNGQSFWYQLDETGQAHKWNQDPDTLRPIAQREKLGKKITLDIYQGNLDISGVFHVYVAFRENPKEGTDSPQAIHYSREPTSFFVGNSQGQMVKSGFGDQSHFDTRLKLLNQGVTGDNLEASQQDPLEISCTVRAQSMHQNHEVKLKIWFERQTKGRTEYYHRDGNIWGSTQQAPEPTQLPSAGNINLEENGNNIVIYNGKLTNAAGHYTFYIGYQLSDGTFLETKQPLQFTIR